MQIHVPDPRYTGSRQMRTSFRMAVEMALAFVALLWLILLFDWALDLDLRRFGVRPQDWRGLAGILFAPLLHANFAHLIANSLPLVVLGSVLLHLYPRAAPRVLLAVYFGPGILVWLFARGGVHIGASGMAYGMVTYILVAGLIRRDRRAIAAALLVCFMYGAFVWGVLPIEPGVSWESHLAGAAIGLVLAIAFRRLDVPPRRRYSWEEEAEEPGTSSPLDEPPRDDGGTRSTLH